MTSNKFLAAATILAVGAASHFAATDAEAAKPGKEKCYGVVKAGKNHCGSKDGAHACAGQAKKDGDANEWVYLPTGVCDLLANGEKG